MRNFFPLQKKKYYIAAAALLLLVLSLAYFYAGRFIGQKNNPNLGKVGSIFKAPEPSASPVPFYDMTIPYLRSKEYKSDLKTIEKISENSRYSSYLTSYQSEGLTINGLLTRPAGDIPDAGWPAIVFVHGYIPPSQYRTLERYGDYIDYLASNGFVVFKIDLRGHGSSDGEAGGGYYSPDYVVDTLNAYTALQSTDFVNPGKIGLWGHSMAGNVTLRALAAKPDIPALVIWAGAGFTYVDLINYRISDASYVPSQTSSERMRRRQALIKEHGQPSEQSSFWRQVSPVSYLPEIKGAIGLHHSVDDPTVNVEYSRNLKKILDATKVPHEYHEYQSGGHNISGSSFNLAMQRTVAFFETYLK